MNAKQPLPVRKLETAAERWSRFKPIVTGEDYLNSLRGRPLKLFLFGKVQGTFSNTPAGEVARQDYNSPYGYVME